MPSESAFFSREPNEADIFLATLALVAFAPNHRDDVFWYGVFIDNLLHLHKKFG